MKQDVLKQAAEYSQEHRRRRRRHRVLSALAMVMVFCTVYTLIMPALTLEGRGAPLCGIEEHVHTDECYGGMELTCGLEEVSEEEAANGHVHTDECYELVPAQPCELPEGEGHTHTDECYETRIVTVGHELICEQWDDPEHVHTDECFTPAEDREEKILVCAQDEYEPHTHTAECLEPEAEKVLVCELEEVGPVHTHTEECYTPILICSKAEHTHTEECWVEEFENEDTPTGEDPYTELERTVDSMGYRAVFHAVYFGELAEGDELELTAVTTEASEMESDRDYEYAAAIGERTTLPGGRTEFALMLNGEPVDRAQYEVMVEIIPSRYMVAGLYQTAASTLETLDLPDTMDLTDEDYENEPAMDEAEPVVDAEPVESAEPVVDVAEPVVEETEPVVDETEPVESAEPVVDEAEPVVDETEPVVDETEPVESAEPVIDEAEPEPVVDETEAEPEEHTHSHTFVGFMAYELEEGELAIRGSMEVDLSALEDMDAYMAEAFDEEGNPVYDETYAFNIQPLEQDFMFAAGVEEDPIKEMSATNIQHWNKNVTVYWDEYWTDGTKYDSDYGYIANHKGVGVDSNGVSLGHVQSVTLTKLDKETGHPADPELTKDVTFHNSNSTTTVKNGYPNNGLSLAEFLPDAANNRGNNQYEWVPADESLRGLVTDKNGNYKSGYTRGGETTTTTTTTYTGYEVQTRTGTQTEKQYSIPFIGSFWDWGSTAWDSDWTTTETVNKSGTLNNVSASNVINGQYTITGSERPGSAEGNGHPYTRSVTQTRTVYTGVVVKTETTTTPLEYKVPKANNRVLLTIEPQPGYYITEIRIPCDHDKKKSNSSYNNPCGPYDCGIMKDQNEFKAYFTPSTGTKVQVQLDNQAFSHGSYSGDGSYRYQRCYILIKTEKIPSPLFVRYEPGTIGDTGLTTSNELFTSGNAWLDGNGRTTVTGNNIEHGTVTDKIKGSRNNGTDWDTQNRDTRYTASGISEAAIELARAQGYRFAGWDLQYCGEAYKGNAPASSSGITWKEFDDVTFPNCESTGMTVEGGTQFNLSRHAKLVAKWEPIPAATVTKQVTDVEENDVTYREFAFDLEKQNAAGEWEKVQDFKIGVRGLASNYVSLSSLENGTYRIIETDNKKAISTAYTVNGEKGNEFVVVNGSNNLNEVLVVNSYKPLPQGFDLTIEKVTPATSTAAPAPEVETETIEDNEIPQSATASKDWSALSGAKFSLYEQTETKDENGHLTWELVGGEGDILPSTVGGSEAATAVKSGLKLDTLYKLEEKEAPAGYNKLTTAIYFKVLSSDPSKIILYDENGNQIDPNANVNTALTGENNALTLVVANYGGFVLPSTGGTGTYVYALGGALLMAAAVILMYMSRKRAGGCAA